MDQLKFMFKLSMRICFIAWIFLIAFPFWEWTDFIVQSVFSVLLCIIYVYLLFFAKDVPGEKYPKGSFKSLRGVTALFKNPRNVLIGWVHYLAFDMLVGLYIKNDAMLNDINHWLVIPCLILTFVFGPLGYLAYFVLRLIMGI